MEESNCLLFIFDSTHQALRGERALKDAGIRHAVVNTPREFSAGCGISLRIDPALKDEAQSALQKYGVQYSALQPYYSRWM